MTSGGTDAACVRLERSATVPTIQPEVGHRVAPDAVLPVYSAISRSTADAKSLPRALPYVFRSRSGNRTATEDKILLPVVRIWAPSRDKASASTVVAGETS